MRFFRHSIRPSALVAGGSVLLAIAFGVIGYAYGGGADKKPAPPRAGDANASAGSATASDSTNAGKNKPISSSSANATNPPSANAPGASDARVPYLHLVDKMQDARIDAKNLAAARPVLAAHWRKMRAPWSPPDPNKLVTSIALRTSATETQWAMPTSAGGAWKPEARVWNMNEGSFDQRDAIAAPTPATITFRVELPQGAMFEFTPGSVNATGDAIEFSVFVTDSAGTRKKAGNVRLAPEDTRRWGQETRVDLGAYAGQTVDLELVAEAAPKSGSEAALTNAPRAHRDAREADGGGSGSPSDETPVTSGATLVGLWGNPTLLKTDTPRAAYNVLFVVIDALRPDVIASFHDKDDDEKKSAAAHPPLEAQLPKTDGLMPVFDELAQKSVVFAHAYSGGAWTRPGTLSMLAGQRSSELGIETTPWVLPDSEVGKFYASRPPLLPLILRDSGVVTRAFVNNYFMVGYAPVGVDMGFERVDDHRYRTKDTEEITKDAVTWLKANADTRFFAFCNYNSPHEPWEPPPRMQKRVPAAPEGPSDRITRLYMAEAAKDDEALGVLLQTLKDLKISDKTIVVVTADHGETLSAAHTGIGLDKMQIRYHHAASNYEETTKIPILLFAPNLPPAFIKDRVRNTDIAPTLLDLLGLPANEKMSGKSLVPLARGQKEADARVVVSEGRGTRAIIWDHYRLLLRDAGNVAHGEKAEELFDLDADPGERINLAPKLRDVVTEMRARLDAAEKNVPTAGSHEARGEAPPQENDSGAMHLRFAGGGAPHRITGKISSKADLTATPQGIGDDAIKSAPHEIEVSFTTTADAAVGIDLAVKPPQAAVTWQFYLDDAPWPDARVFAGPYGIASKNLALGITSDEGRTRAQAVALPLIDPHRDFGLFVTREKKGDHAAALGRDEQTSDQAGEGAEEMNRLLREWGYAHATTK